MKKLVLLLAVFCSTLVFAQEKNLNQAFKVEVKGEGKDIIFIPGAACSGDVWNETVEVLKNTHKCHIITLAGYAGVEPLSSTPILPQYREAIMNYIKEETNKPIIIGHSIGGFIGLQLASESNDLIEKLIVVDALPFLLAASNPAMTEEMAKSYPVEPMVQQYKNMSDSAFKQMQKQVISSMMANEEMQEEVVSWSVASDRKTMAYTMNELMTNDLRDDIGKIEVPVLVLGAWQKSYPVTQEQQKKIYADQYKAIKDLKLEMASNARHFIMYDSPDWYLNQLKLFIQ